METVDKVVIGLIVVIVIGAVALITSIIQTEGFIKNNCTETELVDISGNRLYDCTGVNID